VNEIKKYLFCCNIYTGTSSPFIHVVIIVNNIMNYQVGRLPTVVVDPSGETLQVGAVQDGSEFDYAYCISFHFSCDSNVLIN